MKILGIESTCDETACAIVENGLHILSQTVATQFDLHSQYGGVYPELACRRHFEVLIPLIDETLRQANTAPQEIDAIAVAYGPGLIGALLIGLTAAKGLALAWNIPFVGVNHIEAHLYAAMMSCPKPTFPALGVVISGGHTLLVKIEAVGVYTPIGTTVDDAVGEAFDKVATLLDLPYPGGPEIEKLALKGNPFRYPFKPGIVKGRNWDFSFSGLKTNVLYTVKGQNSHKEAPLIISEEDKADIAASFQRAALDHVAKKAKDAAAFFGCEMIFFGGGVCQNRYLQSLFSSNSPQAFFPPLGLAVDNAVMIAGLGFHVYQRRGHQGDDFDLEPQTRIPFH
ncbi:MAG: tRNA (adenosine(37)-N6)-threonylcarbamoyltransferase complex transferase subunit TsaD [Candidatus Rhabdochlamydia sp.]